MSLSLLVMLALNAMGVLQVPFLWIVPLSAGLLVVLRTFGLSMGNATFSLSVQPASLGKNALRAVALVIPGFNLFDWGYALFDEQHRTWVDKRLGVRVVDASLLFGKQEN